MKNIIKSAICLIVISSILLYSSVSYAEESDCTPLYFNNSPYANTIYSSMGNSDNPQSTATLQFTTNIRLRVNMWDGYFTGYYRFYIDYNLTNLGAGWQLQASNASAILANDANDFYRVVIYSMPNSHRLSIEVAFYNFPCFSETQEIEIGTCTWLYSIYNTNSQSVASIPASWPLSVTYSYQNSAKYFAAQPYTSQSYNAIWKQIIIDAIAAGDLDDVYGLLNQWKTTQDGWLADIVLDIDDLEDILTAMADVLDNISTVSSNTYTKVNQIYTLLASVFPSYSNSVLNKLDIIINQNASDTAAESQMQNAEQQLSQAVNDMEVQKPNINNVVNAGDQYMDSNITGAQSDTFFYLHGSNILVTILVMSVTIGILGFVIYGKSG